MTPAAGNVWTYCSWGLANAPVPAAPAITFSSTGVVVDGDAGVTNYVQSQKEGRNSGDWAALGSVAGDGEVAFGALAEGAYWFDAYSKSATGVFGPPCRPRRRYVGGSARPIEERIWLDAVGALEAEAALGRCHVDREGNRVRDILSGRIPRPQLPYIAAEWSSDRERPGTEEYEDADGVIAVTVLLEEGSPPRAWEAVRLKTIIVQALEADRTRGDLVVVWWHRGGRHTEDVIRPFRLVRLEFCYELHPEPGSRISTT